MFRKLTDNSLSPSSKAPLEVQVYRGNYVESVHQVDAVVMDTQGNIIFQAGDIDSLVFMRSAVKPLQAMSFVMSGAVEKWNLKAKHVCIACASHQGEEQHTETVIEWLKTLQLNPDYLVCGAHWPYDENTKFLMIEHHEKPTRAHNNCSGKHTGMLSTCLSLGYGTSFYERWDHPLQQRLRRQMSSWMKVNLDQAPWGIDGCGIPTYAVPLISMAEGMRLFLRQDLAQDEKSAAQTILNSVFDEPEMISGRKGFCSDVIRTSKRQTLVKVGAEGVYCAVDVRGFTLALKARDGAFRAAENALLSMLFEMQAMDEVQLRELLKTHSPILKNWEGLEVGKILVKGLELL